MQALTPRQELELQDEIKKLKARLEKDNSTLTKSTKPKSTLKAAVPAATGTFNAHPEAAKVAEKHSSGSPANKNFMAAKTQEQSKASWPTMKSVASPVGHEGIKSVAQSPFDKKDDVVPDEDETDTKPSLTAAFSVKPKKVESALAIDADVQSAVFEPDTAATQSTVTNSDAQVPPPTTSWFSPWTWFRSVVSFFTGGAQAAPAAHPAKKQAASLLDVTKKRWLKQDMARTERATKEEGLHTVAVHDVWGEMEQEDSAQEENVRRQDIAERTQAELPESPHIPNRTELKGRHGADMSSFWGSLEKEDGDIEKSLRGDSLDQYEQLRKVQDAEVMKAANQLQQEQLNTVNVPPLKHHDNAFLAKTIHDPWESFEKKDKLIEKKIHDSPDLQMLQLKRRRARTTPVH